MKKWLCLVLAVVLFMGGFSGCKDKAETDDSGATTGDLFELVELLGKVVTYGVNAIGGNPSQTPSADAVDKINDATLQTTVATVNDAVIKRGEVEELLYSQLGYYIYMLDEATLQSYREDVLELLIEQEVARQKAAELGYDQLTAEDLAEVEKSYQEFYNSGIEYFIEILKEEDAGSGVTEDVIAATDYTDRANAELLTYLEENFYYSIERFDGETLLEKYKNYTKDSYIISNKLLLEVTADVTVEETAIKSQYDTLLTEQKQTYDADITVYESDISYNMEQAYYGLTESPIVYVPEGLRYVKHILVMFTEEDQTTVSETYSALSSAEYALENAEFALEEAQTAVTEAADDEALATAQVELATARTELDQAKTEYDAAKKTYEDAVAAASANIKEKVDEVYGKVQAGENFATLIATYGEDPGMQNDMYKDTGYLLSAETTTYYDIFTTTGMALKNVGDYSEPVYSTAGAHIIQYTSKVEAGAVPYEDVKASIEKVLLEEAQNVKFTELLTEWQKEDTFQITRYADALSASLEEDTETESAE